MFWAWLLKYSSFLITGAVSLAVGWLLHIVTTRRPELIHYLSHQQWVTLRQQQNQPPTHIGTVTLFLFNQGKAPAKDVHIGHTTLPAHNVFPDIPREIVQLPSGGSAIRFPVFPARTLVSISYLFWGPLTVEQFLAYVESEDGMSKRIPVMLQRIWPQWWIRFAGVLFFAGLWVLVNAAWTLVSYLWRTYYR